ncbi:class I SAM-dependent methyltransferase [Planococcus lenghuensis]|uniref:Methyltransferase type 11 domain-containing protein n=1 Tax=Planococcus lenghuensis TaxID=2213202 RepID=A0A1Q2L340_9BACL|nr:class I SAM-dependent methyltransferase [Planococcus lenghuensis]AQQ54860.1 hypothetical protein B0X71_18300 [Planococcus lenghuensis]
MDEKKRFNPENAHLLYNEERRITLPPERVIGYLRVKQNDEVADLGAGNGYFTIPLAQMVSKTVTAVDIEPRMLAMLQENAEREKVGNIQCVQSDLESIPFGDRSFDKVLIAFVIHEVEDPDKVLVEVRRLLKPGGIVLMTEWEAAVTWGGPPSDERIPSGALMAAAGRNGFAAERIRLSPARYAIKAYAKNTKSNPE